MTGCRTHFLALVQAIAIGQRWVLVLKFRAVANVVDLPKQTKQRAQVGGVVVEVLERLGHSVCVLSSARKILAVIVVTEHPRTDGTHQQHQRKSVSNICQRSCSAFPLHIASGEM